MENSRAQQRLDSLSEGKQGSHASRSPMDIHMLVLSSYLNNWRSYIESLADQFKDLVITGYLQFLLPTDST